jgi:hypothetical protein
MLDLHDDGPLPPSRAADRPRPIGVREARPANLIQSPRDFGLVGDIGGEMMAEKNSSRSRSSILELTGDLD